MENEYTIRELIDNIDDVGKLYEMYKDQFEIDDIKYAIEIDAKPIEILKHFKDRFDDNLMRYMAKKMRSIEVADYFYKEYADKFSKNTIKNIIEDNKGSRFLKKMFEYLYDKFDKDLIKVAIENARPIDLQLLYQKIEDKFDNELKQLYNEKIQN